MEEITIQINRIIDKKMALLDIDSKKVFEAISKGLSDADKLVIVSFDGIKFVSSNFLEYIIGKVYGAFQLATIASRFKIEGLSIENEQLLEKIIKKTKKDTPAPTQSLKSLEYGRANAAS